MVASFPGRTVSAPSMTVGKGIGVPVGGRIVGQILVSLLKVMYWSQSVTVTSGMPSGETMVEQTALSWGAKRVWQPLSSRTTRASFGSAGGNEIEDGGEDDVDVTPLEKTVEEPLGRKAVAFMVLMDGKGRILKIPLSAGWPGQTVATGS